MTATKTIKIEHPETATIAEIARWYDVNATQVSRWIAAGCPLVRTKPYLLDLEQVEAWLSSRAK